MRHLSTRLPLIAALQVLVALSNIAISSEPIPSSSLLKIEGQVAFTEGPAWHPDGNVYFSDIVNNRIMRRDANGEMHVFRTPSGRTNGIQFDHQGRMLCCEGGGLDSNRRITRTELNGTITVLTDRYQDGKFNSPNDLAVDSKGRVYFTDPRYGDRSDMQQRDAYDNEIEGVYRIDDVGKVERIISHEVSRPNGILVSPDDRYLYVADNVNDGPNGLGGNRKLWRFDLNADGSIEPASRKLLFDWGTDRGPDGLAMDVEGRLYAAAGFNFPNPPVETAEKHKAGIYVIATEGGLLQFIPVAADMITNCTFGDADRKTLYITAGHKLWSVRTSTPGVTVWPFRD